MLVELTKTHNDNSVHSSQNERTYFTPVFFCHFEGKNLFFAEVVLPQMNPIFITQWQNPASGVPLPPLMSVRTQAWRIHV